MPKLPALTFLLLISANVLGQLTGVKTIPGDYPTITAAVTALNLPAGVGAGGVVFNVAPGYTETIASTISLTATGTPANTIVFQKDPNGGSGPNPVITAYTGGTFTPGTASQDGIWRFIGSDYITIDGIDLTDNPANTANPSTMEYGYALYKASTTNGCQFVTITNCVITLNRINNAQGTVPMVDGSVGILAVNSLATTATTIVTVASAAGTNSNNVFLANTVQNCNTGIAIIGYAAASPFAVADQNNDIGGTSPASGNTILNFGGAAGALSPALAIRTLAQYELNVSFNTINNNTGLGNNHETTLRGIFINTAVSAASAITNNTITLKGGGTTSIVSGIVNFSGTTAVGNEVNISNNSIANCTYATATTGSFYGIYDSAATPAILNINNNSFTNNSTAAVTGNYYPIYNSGAVANTLNINNNSINGVTFTAATAVPFIGIYNTGGGTASNLSISNNDFTGISYQVLSTAPNTYISNTATTLSQFISANTFTNLNVNTTGAITFISNSVVVPATGNGVIDDNSIVGAFTRANTATSGTLTLCTSTASNATGSVISNSNNDFSNINVYGAATIAGWIVTDGGSSLKTIQGNVFANWSGGSGSITVLTVSSTGTTNATASNLINNITSAGTITGISTVAGNDNVYSNIISNLSSTGGTITTVSGIVVSAGTTKNIYRNTIRGLSANSSTTGNATTLLSANGIWISAGATVNAYENTISSITANAITTGTVNGITITGGTTISAYRNKVYNLSSASTAIVALGGVNGVQVSGATAGATITIRNNIIGNLRTPAASAADPIRGISLISTGTTSNLNVYYNTIYLNAVSTGTNFGSSGLYHSTSGTSTSAKLDLSNNLLLNLSVASGTGLTVAYRRSNNTLTNYAATSNNNLFNAGSAAPNKLIYYDVTNSIQTLAAYKTLMSTRDAASISENLIAIGCFLSTIDSLANYLHMDDSKVTGVKSGGMNIAGVTLDFDNDIRQGNPGYAGNGTAPDIGADEYAGLSYLPLSGTLNVGAAEVLTSLTNAGGLFAKINRVGLSGNVTVNITSDLSEVGAEALNAWSETGLGNYTVTVQPDGTTQRLISGDVLQGMVRLNGVDRFKIDGGSGKYLTFRNTNISGTTGTAITFINGASNNIIRYCNIEAFTNANNGVVLFSTSPTFSGGNSNNLVEYCNINGTVTANSNSVTGVLSAGTNVAGFENTNDTISNNNIYNYRDRGLEIKSTGSYGWNINGNSFYNGSISGGITYTAASTLHGIRILGGWGYAITNNSIGGSASLATGANAAYTTSTGNVSYQGILLTTSNPTPESNIKGNTIAGINITSFPVATSSVAFYGIETNGSNINIGGVALGDGNIIGSTAANSSVIVTTSATKSTYNTFIRGIYCNSSGGSVLGNRIAGIDIKNFGLTPAPSNFLGIYINNTTAPSKVNNNTIGSAVANSIQVLSSSTSTTTSLTGISVGASVGSAIQLDSNVIKNLSMLNATTIASTGGIIGINTTAKLTSDVVITHNTFALNSTSSTMTSGLFYGIQNTGASASLKINNNTLAGNTIGSVSSVYNAIRNTGAVFNFIEINGNAIGTNSSPAINFTAANSGSQIFINNAGGSPTASLSISNNDVQNINYAASNGTGANTYISNTAATLSQSISSNSFTNLNVQTTGAATFITNNVVVSAAGSQNVNNNFISGTYTKKAVGTVTLLTSSAASVSGSTINISNNNFSNITVAGTSVVNGLVNTDAGNSSKTIQGNVFTNWRGGTGTITVMLVSQTGTNNSTSGNIIRNISDSGNIIGISTVAGNDNINNNIIDSLFSLSGAAFSVNGISVTGGTAKNIYQNVISNLKGIGITTGTVRGILINGGTLVNAYQNKIYGLKADSLTTGTINGINVTAGVNIKVFRNKIYDLSSASSALAGSANGILVSGAVIGLVCTINNNIIGDIRTTSANFGDAMRGIGIVNTGATSTSNVYYNTVYLNASSSGTVFGSAGIYHTTSGTSTTSALNLINNNITNGSVPKGGGFTAAYRINSTALANYGSTSNNNMLYAGTPGPFNVIFYDGTNSDQTLAGFKTRMSTRDAASVSENLIGGSVFSSTIDSTIGYLHIDQSKTTLLRSGGVNISTFTDDFDGDIRFGNAGYTGTGTAPDIGADEFAGLQFLPFSGVYNVGTGQNYTSLTNSNGLFSKINALGLSGNVTVNITSDLSETGAEALNQWAETGAGNYNLVIQPDATTARLISGDVLAGLIRFNGADRVKINGGAGKYLTFKNTNTTGTTGTAFTFINGASFDTVRFCKLEAYANASNGVILFSTTSTGTTGNSDNLLEFNNVNGTVSSLSSITALYSAGTIGKENANNVIANNNIYDYREKAIDISATGSTAWTILNNSLFNGDASGVVNYPAASELNGIRILGGSGYSILNNFIGGNAALATGTNAVYASTLGNVSYTGILLTTSTASPASTIKGNTISKISLGFIPTSGAYAAFTGIETNGSGITIGGTLQGEGNLIGSNSINGSIQVTTTTASTAYTTQVRGIKFLSTGGNITGNRVGGLDITNIGTAPAASTFAGIYLNNSAAPTQVNSNVIGSAGPGAISNCIRVVAGSTALSTSISGIEVGDQVASAMQLNGNTIQNISNLSSSSSGSFTAINNTALSAAAVLTISNNLVKNISSATNNNVNSGVYTGIYSGTPSTISNDTISNIQHVSTGTSAQVRGIIVTGSFTQTVSGNFISDLSTASTKTADIETGSPVAYTLIGILNTASAGAQEIFGNTISNLSSTTTALVNSAVGGIGIATAGASGNIYKNRLASFINTSTGTATLPGITGIVAAAGAFNVYNNAIKIDNGVNSNGVRIYGINHTTLTSWNYFYNSISIGGSALGASAKSAALIRTISGTVVIKNNVLVNTRTGTGANYSISNKAASPLTNWSSAASNYNDLYSGNAGSIAEWGSGSNNTLAQWQSASGGDLNSISITVSFITSPYDLQPYDSSNCTLNNSGIPVTSPIVINTDLNNVSRSGSNPDPGAYEFTYSMYTVTAGSNSPACAGGNVNLFSNAGTAVSPTYSWTNPDGIIFSTVQNPTVVAIAGQYTVSVTDINGCAIAPVVTTVSIKTAPTATISYDGSPYCTNGGIIPVTFTGTIGGTYSSTAGLSLNDSTGAITLATSTDGSFTVTYTVSNGCTSYITTTSLTVNTSGKWTGAVSSNWSTAGNWQCGFVPTSTTNVVIPAGTIVMPVVSDSGFCNNLVNNTGNTVTISNAGVLSIAGILTNIGIFTDNGTTNFNGNNGQQTFSGVTTFNNLILNNSSGLLLPSAIVVTGNLLLSAGTLNANNFGMSVKGNFTNNASTLAFNAGVATVTFNGTTNQNITGSSVTTFNNLSIATASTTVTLNVNTSITGNLIVSTGTFDLAGFTANRTLAGGMLSVANNAVLKIGGTTTFPVNYTTITLVVASTVEYSGTNQSVANEVYGNLKLSSSGGAATKSFPVTTLSVVGNLSSVAGSGNSVLFTASSNINVTGNISIGASTTFNGGSYTHTTTGNWFNNGTYNGDTGTIILEGAGSSVSGSGDENFNNLTIDASGVTFSNNTITLTGNLTTTGPGSFSQTPGATITMSGTAAAIAGSGISIYTLVISGNVTTASSFAISGDLAVSGGLNATSGTITMSGSSKSISGAGAITAFILNITGTITASTSFTITSALLVNGSFSQSAGTSTFTGTSSLSGTANLYNVNVNGTSLTLSGGSLLGIANVLAVTNGLLDATSSGTTTVNFNGSVAQDINGITYSNLTLSNGNIKTATGPLATNFNITIGTGTTFNGSSFTHSVYGSWLNNGSFIAGSGTVQFLGPATAYISGNTTFNILTSNTSSITTELVLQSNVSAAIVNMTNGVIETGSDTLTITNTRNGNGFIHGNIKRIHTFITGVSYAFEGSENTITFSALSAVSSIVVSVVEEAIGDFPFNGSVGRVYDISVPTGTYTAALRLHYEDDELNGNQESTMNLWHYNGSSWASAGKTANSTTSNYVEKISLNDITNRWTFSDNSNLVQWNGSVSSDWNTAANWTVLQGSGSRPPSSTDIVDLGGAIFTNQPSISQDNTVKSIIFGSVKPVVLTLASGGALTTLGDIKGNWNANAAHTINVNDQVLTVNGSANLSDGVTGRSISLNLNTGSVNISGSLFQRGDAGISFTAAGSLDISLDFLYTGGTFTAGSGTVIYSGSENQDIARVNYNNLIISKADGLAEVNDTVVVTGNLLVSFGELRNYSVCTVLGNATIDATGTFINYQDLHVHGNWNNSGTFTDVGTGTYFDGSGAQSITASTFHNLVINKPSGTATLNGNVSLTGDLTINSGTFDIQGYTFDRNLPGGTATTVNGATFMIGANNPPRNFTNNIIGPSSTTIFYGPTPQFIGLEGITFGNLIFRGTGIKTVLAGMTVNGDLTIENLAVLNATSATITLNGHWLNSGTFNPSTGTVLCNGTAKNISGNTTFNKVTVNGSYTILNDVIFNDLLNITSLASFNGGPTIHVTLNGDLRNSGILYTLGTTTFTGNVLQTLSLINSVQTVAITVNFNGSVSPVLNSTSAPQYGFLNINNTGGISPSVGWTIAYSLAIGTGAAFNGGPSTHNILGALNNNGIINSSGTLNFIPSTASTLNFGSNFSSTGNVVFGGIRAITMAGSPVSFYNVVIANTNVAGISPSSAWNIGNGFTINSGCIFNAGSYVDSVAGNLLNNGTINSQGSTFVLNGSANQSVFSHSNFNNVTLKKAGGAAILSADLVFNGVFNFISGTVQTADNRVTQSSTGTVTGASQNTGWVNGTLQKNVTAGSNVSKTFEVGDTVNYTPAALLFAGISVGGEVTASTIPIDHPEIESSGLNKNFDVNRYWALTNTGVTFTTVACTLNWAATDVDPGANTTAFRTGVYNGSLWGMSSSVSPLTNSIQATGLTSLGSFAAGEGFKTAIWTGAAGTADWFTATNWTGGVPDTTVETLIPSILPGASVFPVINTGTAKVDTISIQNGATLTVTNAALQVKGAILSSQALDAATGTIEMNGSLPQTLAPNTFLHNSILNLVVSNDLALAGEDTITGHLSFGSNSKTFNTGGFLTLKSGSTGSATVNDITNAGSNSGNIISGNVNVEHFVAAQRAWNFLTAPITANGAPTIKNSWQEGQTSGNAIPGYGTKITGGSIENGFDQSPANNSSLKTYNSPANSWVAALSTNTAITNAPGYMLFVRGDRSISLAQGTFTLPTNTILRARGILKTGDQSFPVAASNFTVIGNPYASAINLNQIGKSNSTNIQDNFYVWDPQLSGSSGLGAFVNISWNVQSGKYDVTPAGGSEMNQYIQSGMAFFARSANGTTSGSLVVKETDKTDNGYGIVLRSTGTSGYQKISTTLFSVDTDGTSSVLDGTLNCYGEAFSNAIDKNDAIKIGNFAENLSLQQQGQLLTVERKQPLTSSDTVAFKISQLKVKSYKLQFAAYDPSMNSDVMGFLEDVYLHTTTIINFNGSTTYNFNVIDVPGSWNPDRFRIVFKKISVLPVTLAVSALREKNDIRIKWIVNNESGVKEYGIEGSADGRQFTAKKIIIPGGNRNGTSNYHWLDESISKGNNFYRIKCINNDGGIQYSKVVKVFMASDKPQIVLTTNVVTGGAITFKWTNMPDGTYSVTLLNTPGQVLYRSLIKHSAVNNTETIVVDTPLAKGIYLVEFTTPDGNTITEKLVVL